MTIDGIIELQRLLKECKGTDKNVSNDTVLLLIEKILLAEKIISTATDKLSSIAWCSNIVGDGGSSVEHRLRWVEKATKAREALCLIEGMNKSGYTIITGSAAPIDWGAYGVRIGSKDVE